MPNKYYGWVDEVNDNVLTFNPSEFNKILDEVHTVIDSSHDQKDPVRSSSRLQTDKAYAARLSGIIASSARVESITCFNDADTGITYNLRNESVHKLSGALVRKNGKSRFTINNIENTDLPIYTEIDSVVANASTTDYYAGQQLELRPFDPNDGSRTPLVRKIRDIYGEGSVGWVQDCGSSDVFRNITDRPATVDSTSVFSGVMDSSSSSEMIADIQIQEFYQIFIPFMRINAESYIWLYATPYKNGQIFTWFSTPLNADQSTTKFTLIKARGRKENIAYFSSASLVDVLPTITALANNIANAAAPTVADLTVADQATASNGYSGALGGACAIITEVPNLPDVSNYIASEGYNAKKKCIDIFIKSNFFNVQAKCNVFLNIVRLIFGITGNVITQTQQYVIDLFFMQIKHFGDRFRAIDAILLSRLIKCLTGTADTFLMRWICLGEMYGCYSNTGTNLILCDVRKQPDRSVINDRKYKNFDATYKDANAMNTYFNNSTTEYFEKNIIIRKAFVFLKGFFENISIFQPRGRVIRKLVSIVAPKSFYAEINSKQYLYREEEIPILWDLYNILYVLSSTTDPTTILAPIYNATTIQVNLGLSPYQYAKTNYPLPDDYPLPTKYPLPANEEFYKIFSDETNPYRAIYYKWIDSKVVYDEMNKLILEKYPPAELLKSASRIVKTHNLKDNLLKYSSHIIQPWHIDIGRNALGPDPPGLVVGGKKPNINKQIGGINYTDILDNIARDINKSIDDFINSKYKSSRSKLQFYIEYKSNIVNSRPTIKFVIIMYHGDYMPEARTTDVYNLPLMSALYSDIEANYSLEYNPTYFSPELMEQLRLSIYTSEIDSRPDIGKLYDNIDDTEDAMEESQIQFTAKNTSYHTPEVINIYDIFEKIIIGDIIIRIQKPIRKLFPIIGGGNVPEEHTNDKKSDVSDQTRSDVINLAIVANELAKKEGQIKIIKQFNASIGFVNNTITQTLNRARIKTALYHINKLLESIESINPDQNKDEINKINQYIANIKLNNEANIELKKLEDLKKPIEVTLNRAAVKSAMDEFAILCRNNAEKLENYYGNGATDDNAYVEYLKSKIALDKYYLSLYDREDLDEKYVNCTQSDFALIFDDTKNEVDAEKDKSMLKYSIQDNSKLIESMAKNKNKGLTMKTGLTPEEFAEMNKTKSNVITPPLLTGYGGKSRAKTMKPRTPLSNKTRRKLFRPASSEFNPNDRKKTKRSNRPKKNKTRRKRNY